MEDPLDRLLRPLAALTRWFSETGLQAAVIGGVAASLRGTPRLTKDIDAVVLDADAETLVRSGTTYQLTPRIPDAIDFAHETRVLLLRFSPNEVDIDISLGALPFEEEVVERSSLIDVGGLQVRVATATDLVIMKAVAGRPRDVVDIENLIDANPDLDVDRIRRWVREFAAVLDMPEIHENLEAQLRRRQR
ncbi:MAG TPA: nucleotidyl transferase AbiEii/AbiGii toxin family protein [Thermoanaerobaculia bacterium]|nr:nucleotidyl transferase AbiEii/AbiGii toxin family protein [Thermoanaerobaculia bacterium]